MRIDDQILLQAFGLHFVEPSVTSLFDKILGTIPIVSYGQAIIGRDLDGRQLPPDQRIEKTNQGIEASIDALISGAMTNGIRITTGNLWITQTINPQSLYGKSKADVSKMLGPGWVEGTYGSAGGGWKFTKGDQSIFYHPGGGIHGGSYYGYSSGVTGKIKIVGPDYVQLAGDKATIIQW